MPHPAAKRPRHAAGTTSAMEPVPVTATDDAVPDVVEEQRDWANLLPDFVRKISDDLLAADVTECIRLRAVCKPWRNCTADPSLLDPKFFPRKWLLLAEEHVLRRDGEPERFVNVRTGAVLHIYLPTPTKYTHHGNAEGLLVLHDAITDRVRLLNPLTMAFTDLPSMSAVRLAAGRSAARDAAFCKHSIMAAGVIVDVVDEAGANPVPTVVLSLRAGTDVAIVCAQPGDIFWAAVDMSCADEIEGELPAIQGGLSVQGGFFVPSCSGDVLGVELRPKPRLTFVARQAREDETDDMNVRSYLVPALNNDVGSGMLLVRTWGPGHAYYQVFTVDLGNGTLTLHVLCGTDTTVFLPSVTLRSSAFPRVRRNRAYAELPYMRMLMCGDYI